MSFNIQYELEMVLTVNPKPDSPALMIPSFKCEWLLVLESRWGRMGSVMHTDVEQWHGVTSEKLRYRAWLSSRAPLKPDFIPSETQLLWSPGNPEVKNCPQSLLWSPTYPAWAGCGPRGTQRSGCALCSAVGAGCHKEYPGPSHRSWAARAADPQWLPCDTRSSVQLCHYQHFQADVVMLSFG